MSYQLVKITEKGQMTIPVDLRKKLQLKPGDYLSVSLADEHSLVLKKARFIEPLSCEDPIWDLIGKGKSGKSDTSEKHDQYVAESEIAGWREK